MMAYGKDPERSRPPHWMRSMEEKYQRLHAKVSDQAIRHSQSRNSLSVRLRELRQRTYNTVDRRSMCKSSSDDVRNCPLPSQNATVQPDQSPGRPLLISSAVELRTNQNPSLKSPSHHNKLDNCSVNDRAKSVGTGAKKRSSSSTTATTLTTDPLSPEFNTFLPDESNTSFYPSNENSPYEMIDACGEQIGSNNHELKDSNIHECGRDFYLSTAENTKMEEINFNSNTHCLEKESKRLTRPVSVPGIRDPKSQLSVEYLKQSKNKTNMSGNNPRSFKTMSRSSPKRKMKSQSATALHRDQHPEFLEELVFSSMSQEAQHAKHETLKDMTLPDGPEIDLSKNCDAVVPGAYNIEDNEIKVAESEKNETKNSSDDDFSTTCDDYTDGLNLKPDISNKYGSSSGSNVTATNKELATKRNRSIRQRLKATPCVGAGKYHDDLKMMQSPKLYCTKTNQQVGKFDKPNHDYFISYRSPLPAIRQMTDWQSHGEHSFKITAPDFDVRFCETSANPKEDCEAPPEDIRRQSIEKCRLWLERQLGKL